MTKWIKMKAMESCWGSENIKLYTVELKKAIAKCSNEDAPELSLPPYRSSYRFVNAMINQGNNMDMMMKMKMKNMMRSNYQNDDEQLFNEFFKSMGSSDRMDNYRTGSYRKNDPMSQFKQMFNSYRSKRQATDSLDLGD